MAKMTGAEAAALVQYQYDGRDIYNDGPYPEVKSALIKVRGKVIVYQRGKEKR